LGRVGFFIGFGLKNLDESLNMCQRCDGSGRIECPECFGNDSLCRVCFNRGWIHCPICNQRQTLGGKKSWQKSSGGLPGSAYLRKPTSQAARNKWPISNRQGPPSITTRERLPNREEYEICCTNCGHQVDLTEKVLDSICAQLGKNVSIEDLHDRFTSQRFLCPKCSQKHGVVRIKSWIYRRLK